MKKFFSFVIGLILICLCFAPIKVESSVKAKDVNETNYFTIYDYNDRKSIVLIKGEGVESGDKYISSDNKMYEIVNVDENKKIGYAKYIEDVQLPKYNVKPKSKTKVAKAKNDKTVGIYHTHNDESYLDVDETDSVYGAGGIHDIGKKLKNDFEKLGVTAIYSEDLHLPHNSGAYTRSQVTASSLLSSNKLQGLFDIHRDSTPRSEYQIILVIY